MIFSLLLLFLFLAAPLSIRSDVKEKFKDNTKLNKLSELRLYQFIFVDFYLGWFLLGVNEFKKRRTLRRNKNWLEYSTQRIYSEVSALVSQNPKFHGLVQTVLLDIDSNTVRLIFTENPTAKFEDFKEYLLKYSQLSQKNDTDIEIIDIGEPYIYHGRLPYQGYYTSELDFADRASLMNARLTHAKVEQALNSEVKEVNSAI